MTFCFNQFPSGVGESALKGKAVTKKESESERRRETESGLGWKWTLGLKLLH